MHYCINMDRVHNYCDDFEAGKIFEDQKSIDCFMELLDNNTNGMADDCCDIIAAGRIYFWANNFGWIIIPCRESIAMSHKDIMKGFVKISRGDSARNKILGELFEIALQENFRAIIEMILGGINCFFEFAKNGAIDGQSPWKVENGRLYYGDLYSMAICAPLCDSIVNYAIVAHGISGIDAEKIKQGFNMILAR